MTTVKKLFPFVIVLALVALGGIAFGGMYTQNEDPLALSEPEPDGTYSMVLTEHGYEPKTLIIPLGTTVVFGTSRDKYHWPASNLHPNHEIYSEFDPKKPVPPNETWSFTFDRAGAWNLHDHLRSYYRASIRVVE